ncbi:MAG: PepSY-associated TM helix domain-containing protein [Pseudomonadota bacterium]
MHKKLNRYSRKIHFWGAIIIAFPVVIVIGSGLLLQLKKELDWVQPPTMKATPYALSLSFDQILQHAKKSTQAQIQTWEDIDRLDVRPKKGIVKIRAKNGWEVQLDLENGQVLHQAFRRSDLIESIHDGSFFHDQARLLIFLPAAIVLFLLWLTGMYMFCVTLLYRRRSHRKARAFKQAPKSD